MFADIGGVPAVVTKHEGDHHDRSFGWGWIFALVIIFLALVFLWGRNDHRKDGTDIAATIAPLAAAKMMEGHGGHGRGGYGWDMNESHREHWDILRDQNRENSQLRFDVSENRWILTREMDQNQFRTMEQISMVKAEVAASERRVLEKIEQDRYDRVKDERDLYRYEAVNLRFHSRPVGWGTTPVCDPVGYAI